MMSIEIVSLILLGIAAAALFLGRGNAGINVTLTQPPNVLGMYIRAAIGRFTKHRWLKDAKKLPAIQVCLTKPVKLQPPKLHQFKELVGWQRQTTDHVPVMYLITETFRLAMYVMTCPAFPFTILGTVVNKKARYTLRRQVQLQEQLVYSCRLSDTPRHTPGGHLEFDIIATVTSASAQDEEVWSAVLTLVLLSPKKVRSEKKAPEAASAQEWQQVAELALPEAAGRRYAALDGDRSPMHLYCWSARLMGFPRPVANVAYLVASAEATIAEARGPDVLVPPVTIEAEFKRPTLLPTQLLVLQQAGQAGEDWGKALAGPAGYQFKLTGAKAGRDVMLGCIRSG